MPQSTWSWRHRASPLWQLVHHGWDDFLANYESKHLKNLGPFHSAANATVESFLRCGDLASGFTRLQAPSLDRPLRVFSALGEKANF